MTIFTRRTGSFQQAHVPYITVQPIVALCAYRNPVGLELGPGLGIKWVGLWQVSEFCQCSSQVSLAKVSVGVDMAVCECVCKLNIRQHSLPTSTSSPDTSNKTKQAKVLCCVCVCVWMCTLKKGHVCSRVVDAVTNLPRPPDGSRSKVTELLLDKHRSPASISHPLHFGNT